MIESIGPPAQHNGWNYSCRAATKLSSVAGILDKDGGLRVVVTQRWRMRHHVGRGERLFVVPDYEVQEPVPWVDIAPLIERVQEHIAKTLAPTNHCGGCRACCITPYLKTPEFTKPSHTYCHNCGRGGCKMYWNRPQACREFECAWLKSQSRNDVMPPELRPDCCGVIFVDKDTQGGDPLVFEVHPDIERPDCINAPIVRNYIDEMQRAGYKAKLITHYVGEQS
jgi:hypothetical protein